MSVTGVKETSSPHTLLVCPACGSQLRKEAGDGGLVCTENGHLFKEEAGIPLLFWPNDWDGKQDVTQIVRSFYEENPFPNYDELESSRSLREKAERGYFARWLDDQIPFGAKILEVGCGTGQLSNFLGLRWGRTVYGADLCLNSLRLGAGFKKAHNIENTSFVQMNLFKPVFAEGSFDIVICNGVLHHTSDPFLGFQSISKLVAPGGYIMIGLYNTYGRLTTDLRRLIFKYTGDTFKFLDPRLRTRNLSSLRKRIWYMDQYEHPHESKHTLGELQDWFERENFDFVSGIPKPKAFETFSENEEIFKKQPAGTGFDHFIVQAAMLLKGGAEGGFYSMVGQRRS